MAVAQGIRKQTVYKAQGALGTAASGSGGQVLRRRSSTFTLDRDSFESDEIVTHQQSTGASYGGVKVNGRISGLLSAGTYEDLFANLLRADFAATSPISSLTLTIGGSAGAWTVTRSAGDFLTGGIKAGDVVRLSGANLAAGNVGVNLLVRSLTATELTCTTLNGAALTTESSKASSTVTVVGKKCKPPLTGHTDTYLTFEEWYADLSKSELFADCKIGSAEIGLPSTGNVSVDFAAMGLSRTLGTSQVLTTPTAETTSSVLTAVNGVVYVNGSAVGNCTGASLSINGNVAHGDAVLGSNYSSDLSKGRIAVSGQITGLFDSTTLQAFYTGETPVSLVLVVTDDETADADFVAFSLGRIKIMGDAPDDGEKQIVRTYPFVAEICSTGGPSLAWDQTIITVQDSLA